MTSWDFKIIYGKVSKKKGKIMTAITPPKRIRRDSNPIPFEGALDAYKLRVHVIEDIGKQYLDGFELWAFKCENGMIYDKRIVFLWNCAHKSSPINGSHVEAIDCIIKIWKKRFEDENAQDWPKISFGD
jgi:hypothetical protein